MAVPTYDRCMLPLLQFASDEQQHHVQEAIEALAEYFQLGEADRSERIPSGKKFRFDDRVQWANTYLKKAGLLCSEKRGHFRITDRGLDVLEQNPGYINPDFLMRYPEFVEFKTRRAREEQSRGMDLLEAQTQQTPQEILQASYRTLRDELAQELLDVVF